MFFENFNLTVNIFQKLMHKNTWESHFLKIFKKCEVFFTQKVVFFQVFGWCFGLVFLGFELVFWAHDVLATLPDKILLRQNLFFETNDLIFKQTYGKTDRTRNSRTSTKELIIKATFEW